VQPETLSGRGTVVSYTVNHQPWVPQMAVPFIIAVVELREQKNLRLTTNLINCSPETARIGLPVRVAFRTVSDEVALPVFEPDSSEGQGVATGQGSAPAPPSPGAPTKITETEYVLARPPRRVAAVERLERKAIISGVGQSAIGRRLFRSDIDLTVEASLAAIADAGLRPDDIDGIAAYPGGGISAYPGFAGPGVAEMCDALGLSVSWHLGAHEGPGQAMTLFAACLALGAGLCRHVLAYRTVSEGTAQALKGWGRPGIGAESREVRGATAFLLPYGAMSAANWLAINAVRHMHEYGTKREHLGAIALADRRHAALNPACLLREPLTLEDYLRARMVSWPLGLYDCDLPCDGSTALIVSSADTAADRPKPPVRINAIGTALRSRPSWDQWEDLTTFAARDAAAQMWARTDLTPADVDVAQLYDGFSFLTLVWLEALGFCKKGEGGPFVEGGRIELGGELPINTWGGQLSGGRLHGFGHLAEAVRQLRGECGARQVPDCEVAAVGVGGGPVSGCLLLTR
jgi:acetyl-CoA acetyltransferase